MDRSALSRIASKIANDPPYQGTEVTAMPKQKEETLDFEPYEADFDEPKDGSFTVQKIVKEPDGFHASIDGMFQGKPFQGVLVLYGDEAVNSFQNDGWDWKPGPDSAIGPVDEATDPIQRMMDIAGEIIDIALDPDPEPED